MKLFTREPMAGNEDIEKKFKENFITTFLATWVANNYHDACINNQHDMLHNPPVEDAEHLAQKAWEKVVDLIIEAPGEDK